MTAAHSAPTPAAAERHPHLAEPRREGWLRVDCHSHTMWSGDCTTTPDEIAEAVAAAALDVLCVTDHHAVKGASSLAERLDCLVVVGEEVRSHRGEIIGLFLTERVPQGLPARETAQRIRDQGGLVYIPHPFDELRHNLDTATLVDLAEDGLVDALEVFNAKTSLQSINRRAAELAGDLGLPGGAGSDAHVPEALGAAYVEMPPFTDPTSFLIGLGQARVVGHHSDPARRWRPRIVPSTS